ncbi:unnamed protein product [Discula destructiva]
MPIAMTAARAIADHNSPSRGPESPRGRELRYQRLKEKEEQKKTYKALVAQVEAAFLPLILPNHLYLSKAKIQDHDGEAQVRDKDGTLSRSAYGFQIAANAGGGPLLVGCRHGSPWRNKLRDIALCLGEQWYASAGGPWLLATSKERSLTVKHRSPGPDLKGGIQIRTGTAIKINFGSTFRMAVPNLEDNTLVLQEFEWLHKARGLSRLFPPKRPEPLENGLSILVQRSTKKTVARMGWGDKQGNLMTGDFKIEFLNAGCTYGGAWKILSFVIGVMTF